MHLTQLDEVCLPHQRLAAGVDIHVGPKFFALTDDGVDSLQAEIELVSILSRPAAGTVHIAGGGGVQQNGPGHIAVLPLFDLFLGGAALQAGVKQKVLEKGAAYAGIQLVDPQDQLVPIVLFLNGLADGVPLALIPLLRGKPVHQGHELRDVLLRIPFNVLQSLIDGKVLHIVFHVHRIHPFAAQFRLVKAHYRESQRKVTGHNLPPVKNYDIP